MISAPSLRIRNIHLVAQHIPDDARLDTRCESLHHAHALKRGELLVMGKTAAIAAAENLLKQLPKLPFAHSTSIS